MGIRAFARGLQDIVVVEEKLSFIESQMKELFYNFEGDRPSIVGKFDEQEKELLPHYGANCPIAVVHRASWPDQDWVSGTLATIEALVQAKGFRRTALIVVGRVLAEEYEPLLKAIYDCPVPTIAAVNGWAWTQKPPTGPIRLNSTRRIHMSMWARSTGVAPNRRGSGWIWRVATGLIWCCSTCICPIMTGAGCWTNCRPRCRSCR